MPDDEIEALFRQLRERHPEATIMLLSEPPAEGGKPYAAVIGKPRGDIAFTGEGDDPAEALRRLLSGSGESAPHLVLLRRDGSESEG